MSRSQRQQHFTKMTRAQRRRADVRSPRPEIAPESFDPFAFLDDFGAFCAETPSLELPAPPLTSETMVVWDDGSVVRFGDLLVQDKKTVAYNADIARYEGGY